MTALKEDPGPPVTERRARLLKEAANVFYEKGFAGACIDDLIARAGGSKRTIYNEFGSKEGLFTAMIEDVVSRYAAELVAGLDADEQRGADLRQVLTDYGRHLMRVVMKPDVLCFHRTIIGEGMRFPKLAATYWESGPGRSIRRFSQILEDRRGKGEIDVDDCHRAAEHFTGLIRDSFYFAVLLGLRDPPSEQEMDARVAAAVDLFLHGVTRRS